MSSQTDTAQTDKSDTFALQPMGFGEILDTIFNLYRKHFRLFLGIIALYFCGNVLVYLLRRFLPNFPLKSLGTDLINMPFGLISMGGIILATATIHLGGHTTSREVRIVVVMIGFILFLTKVMGETTAMDIFKWVVMYSFDSGNPLFYVIMGWINMIVGTLIFSIWVIGITLLYFDLRIRKEGLDIEMQLVNG